MALLELSGRKFPIPAGEIVLGTDPASAVPLSGSGVLPRHAKLTALPDGQVVISKAEPQAEVLINGVRLGAEPTPLLHGDKLEVGGHELTFVDERRSGSTQYVQAMSLPQALEQAKGAGGVKPTGNTGGRVVSLTDGREYAIAGASLVFGRDATCDVVVPGKDVSRRHAEIVQTPKGYLLVDSSTNGSYINDARVEGQKLLSRADVIRIGEESFRFYADVASPPAPNPPSGPAARPPAEPPHPSPAPASERVKDPLGSFLVRSGTLKGQRLVVKTPVVNIGRADYNDLILPDESVSTAHAKLQRREGVWVLVDLDSTNGTFVDGERIAKGGESPLAPGATVRFGEISLVFEPTDDALGVAKGGGTRMMEAMKPAAAPPPAKPKPPASPPPRPRPTRPRAGQQPKKGKGCGSSAALFIVGVAGLVYWVFV
ncbi:MAG: FHA domain-containing protein [Gemmatimonadales bacterium]